MRPISDCSIRTTNAMFSWYCYKRCAIMCCSATCHQYAIIQSIHENILIRLKNSLRSFFLQCYQLCVSGLAFCSPIARTTYHTHVDNSTPPVVFLVVARRLNHTQSPVLKMYTKKKEKKEQAKLLAACVKNRNPTTLKWAT